MPPIPNLRKATVWHWLGTHGRATMCASRRLSFHVFSWLLHVDPSLLWSNLNQFDIWWVTGLWWFMIGVFWYFFSNWWTFPFYIVAQCCRHAFPHLHAHRLSHPENGWVSSSCLSKTCAAWAKAGNNWKYISDTDLDVRWYFMIFVNYC